MPRVGHHPSAVETREAPTRARDKLGLGVRLIAHDQHGVALVEVGRLVGRVTAVGQEEVRDVDRRLELDVDAALQPAPVGAERFRSVEAQKPTDVRRQITLPAAGDHDPTASHQPTVAGVDRGVRIAVDAERGSGGVVEVGQAHHVAAVDDVDQHTPAGPRAIDGKQDRDVGRARHSPGSVARGESEIGDRTVGPIGGIDGEVDAPTQFLVRTDVPERASIRERPSPRDLETPDRHRIPPARPMLRSAHENRKDRVLARGRGPAEL